MIHTWLSELAGRPLCPTDPDREAT